MSADLARAASARAASACPVIAAAVRLSEWVGADGLRVTAGGALRPADVAGAARAVGAPAPAKVRRAADVPEVHRPWLVAVGAGLIAVSDKRAVQAGKLDDPLDAWWAGVQALLAAEVVDTSGSDPRITAAVTLAVVTEHGQAGDRILQRHVEHLMRERGDWDYWAGPPSAMPAPTRPRPRCPCCACSAPSTERG